MPAISRPPVPLTPDNQRRSQRPRVLLAGRLIYGDAWMTIDCAIRDLTVEGAKLRLSGPAILPPKVTLIEIGTGMTHTCEVTWRRLPDIGVKFLSSDDLNLTGAPEPELARLRLLWQGARAR